MHDDLSSNADPLRRISTQISINASTERVWSLLTDIDSMPGLHPQMVSARWLDDASEAALGVWFNSVNIHEDLMWESTSRIVEFRPCRAIAWTVESSVAPPTVCRFELVADSDAGEDRTLVRQTYVFATRPDALPPVEQAVNGSH
jgi:uncharacterized membrane protein